MKKIYYVEEIYTQQIARMKTMPKAEFFNEGDLPKKGVEIEIKTAVPPQIYQIKRQRVFTINWIKYIFLRLIGKSDNDIINT